MRVDLQSDPKDFVKQLSDLRRFLNKQEQTTKVGLSARFMTAALVPYLTQLRTELRQDGYDPGEIMQGTATLMGNIAASVVQSMFDGLPPDKQQDLFKRIVGHAFDNAVMTSENDARMERDAAERTRPKLAVVPKDAAALGGDNVVPIKPTKGEGK